MATKLTTHFTLEEMCFSTTAARRGIPNMVTADSTEGKNLKALCDNVLEPFRARTFAVATPIHIMSGFRSKDTNKAVGGAKNSQHMVGQAADITVPGMTPMAVCLRMVQLELPFDQLIMEFGQWTHVSYSSSRARGSILTAIKVNGKTKYTSGLSA